MDEAAPQAASRSRADLVVVSRVLEALRLAWGDAYQSGHDEQGHWAAWPDRAASLIHAGIPEELGRLLADGFGPGRS